MPPELCLDMYKFNHIFLCVSRDTCELGYRLAYFIASKDCYPVITPTKLNKLQVNIEIPSKYATNIYWQLETSWQCALSGPPFMYVPLFLSLLLINSFNLWFVPVQFINAVLFPSLLFSSEEKSKINI